MDDFFGTVGQVDGIDVLVGLEVGKGFKASYHGFPIHGYFPDSDAALSFVRELSGIRTEFKARTGYQPQQTDLDQCAEYKGLLESYGVTPLDN
ncbi:MAG: hypothetical protein KJ601_02200 [Nanoarchaeota archaeon]|nr:hypothetical protein [Nanoarchaeota archaeon]MBU1704582.1 hypothetical protein [Nanoarchaeota archaeon]